MTSLTPDQEAMALGWYGYGRWDAPYWFVGMEPGGDDLDECVRMWNALGRQELIDIQGYREDGDTDYVSPNAEPQRTWQKLIWLLLAYKGQEPTPAAVLDYQHRYLGSGNGESALVELSGLPARNNGVDVPRMMFRDKRTSLIREQMFQHKPKFAVFYSVDNSKGNKYVDAWEAITGVNPLWREEPVMVGSTACVMTYHPNGQWSKAYWVAIGEKLRKRFG